MRSFARAASPRHRAGCKKAIGDLLPDEETALLVEEYNGEMAARGGMDEDIDGDDD